MKTSQSFQPATPIQDEHPSFPPFSAHLENIRTPPHLIVPQTQRPTLSTPYPPPVNPYSLSKMNIDFRERPRTLKIAPNTHNSQSNNFTNSTATTHPIPNTIYSHQPILSTLTFPDATRFFQSIVAPPLTIQSAGFNSPASSSFILPLSTPPIPSNLFTSSLTSFPSTQSVLAIDLTTNATRMPIPQRLALLSISTLQFSALPYNIQEAMHALYPPTTSSITTINETRDIHIPQFYLHAIPYNPTLIQV